LSAFSQLIKVIDCNNVRQKPEITQSVCSCCHTGLIYADNETLHSARHTLRLSTYRATMTTASTYRLSIQPLQRTSREV